MASFWDRVGTSLVKAGPPPPDSGDEGDDGDGPPGAGGFGDVPPPKQLPPTRDLPEPVQGDGPTLAAPAPQANQSMGPVVQAGQPPAQDPQALLWDPYAVVDALGYKDRASQMTHNVIRAMIARMPILEAIIKTRIDQVTQFAEVQQDEYSSGFHVQMRDRNSNPTPAAKRRIQELERWILTTGYTENAAARDTFSTFLKKVVRDSLQFDQMTWEVVPSNDGRPSTFYAVDATSIRIADTVKLFTNPEDRELIRYVQIYDGLVVAQWPAGLMQFGIRNPETDIRLQGYGVSEIEKLIRTITALLYAWDYNQAFFQQGTAAKGIINFKGAIPDRHLRAFRSHWYRMTSGIQNAFRTPIVNSEDLQWINLQMANKDMEYSAWFDFLIKITAAVFGLDPMEINFKYGDSGGGKSMFESNNTAKLSASKDKGLRPLLKFLEERINVSLIYSMDEDFEFQFVGLDADSKSEEADLITKTVKTYKTIDEVRAAKDLAPLPNGMGAIILDPVYLQHLTLAQQTQDAHDQASQQAAADGTGAPGEVPEPTDSSPDGGADAGATQAEPSGLDGQPEDVQGEVVSPEETQKSLVLDFEF